MSTDDIIKIIDAIPKYIIYIYPGYLTIYLYYFLRAKSMSDSKAALLKSIAISYIYVTLINKIPASELWKNFVLIIISIMAAYLSYLFVKSKDIAGIFHALDIEVTCLDNEIEALQGFDKGAWLVIYLKDDDVVYEGWLHHKDLEQGRKQYIIINGFRKYFIDDDGSPKQPYIEEHDNELEEEVMILYDNIKRIEKRKTV